MANRQIIRVAFSLAIIHLLLTSFVGSYAANQVGRDAGENVARFLITQYEPGDSNVEQSYREVERDLAGNTDKWQWVFVACSLPIRFVLQPMLLPISSGWFHQVTLGELSFEEWRLRVYVLTTVKNVLNSMAFGLMVYFVLRLARGRNAP